jgi:fructose-bisphosphate aldolase class 1
MKAEMTKQAATKDGFIAALDQSGGSTPKALRLYGVPESAYSSDEEMYRLVHEMRARIIKSPATRYGWGRRPSLQAGIPMRACGWTRTLT